MTPKQFATGGTISRSWDFTLEFQEAPKTYYSKHELPAHAGKCIEARRFEKFVANPLGLRKGYPLAVLRTQRRMRFGWEHTTRLPQDTMPRLPHD
jgi:hypothetical protein